MVKTKKWMYNFIELNKKGDIKMTYQTILKNEAEGCAELYYPRYIHEVRKGNIDFKKHLKERTSLKKSTIKDIIFENFELFMENFKVDPYYFETNKEEREKLVKKVSKDFLTLYKNEYKKKISELISKIENGINEAKEYKLYLEERRYIGEEELIGGAVSEEEREILIKEQQELIQKNENELSLYKQALALF